MSNFCFKGDTLYRLIPSEGIDLFIPPDSLMGEYNITGHRLSKELSKWCRWWRYVEPLFPPTFIPAYQRMMSSLVGDLSTLASIIDTVHKELVRGVIQQQLW